MSPSFPPRLWVTIFLNNIKLILFVDELQGPLLSAPIRVRYWGKNGSPDQSVVSPRGDNTDQNRPTCRRYGLYLSISKNGGRRWVFLYRANGKLREKGLGSATKVSLKDARQAAEAAGKLLREGTDPIDSASRAESTKTFSECARSFIISKEAGWRNAKHPDQWTNTLKTYADPIIGKLPVNQIGVDHIVKVL